MNPLRKLERRYFASGIDLSAPPLYHAPGFGAKAAPRPGPSKFVVPARAGGVLLW